MITKDPTPPGIPGRSADAPLAPEGAPDVVPLLAPELLVATVSPRGERVATNAEWDLVFGTDDFWDRLQPEDRRFAEEYVLEAAAGSLVTNQAFLVSRAHRDLPAPVLLHFLPVRVADAPAGRHSVMITGEMLQEPASWAQDQTKRRRMEMVGQMAMGIAHDFNNLLTSLLGHVELLKEEVDGGGAGGDGRAHAHLESMERAALDGAALVRKIQRYIRHEKQERFDQVDLRSVMEEVAALTRPYWQNEPRRLGISIRLAREVEQVPAILGSEAELREVLVNLVLNAVQAMPEGGNLTLRVFGDEEGVYAEVEDSGMGMPESVRNRIFEPLFTTKGESGTGMGLTVSYGIVEEHDGQIRVRTAPGRGTCFTLRFPPARRGEAPAPEPAVTSPVLEVASGDHALHLLVVDDEPMVRSVTAQLLRLRGYTVDEAASGLEALRYFNDNAYDLVLTDLGMPEMSGSELAREMRKAQPQIPIIMLTGHTDAEDLSEHVDEVVRKPFKIGDLVERIRDVAG